MKKRGGRRDPAAFCVLMALSRPLGHLPALGPGNGVQRALRENDGENRVPADWEEQKKVLRIDLLTEKTFINILKYSILSSEKIFDTECVKNS